MPSLNLIVAATSVLAAFASAVPHARNHYHLHGRPIEIGAPLAARSIYDGKCGPGDSCGPGYCCSQWGYCGITQDYCGTGCQPQFGTCGSSNGTAPADTTAAPSVTSSDSSIDAPAATASSVETTAAASSIAFVSHAYGSALGAPATYNAPSPPQTTFATQTSAPAQAPAPAAPTAQPAYTAPAPAPSYSAPAPAPSGGSSGSSSGGSVGSDVYKMFIGTGATSAGWPSMSSWASFDSLWNDNLPVLKISCAQFGAADNSDQENADIKSAITSVAASSGVDERFILAIMMQESKGCVRVPTTNGGVRNPGLMQSHDGKGDCTGINPCPASEITQMIEDGVDGTSEGPGLKQLIQGTDAEAYYRAARMYNSGSVAPSGDLGQGIATHCYCSDVANRLMGWTTSPTACTL